MALLIMQWSGSIAIGMYRDSNGDVGFRSIYVGSWSKSDVVCGELYGRF